MRPNTKSKKQRTSGDSEHEMHAEGLRELFINELKDIYWAEKALTKAIQKISHSAVSEELKEVLTDHYSVTEDQVKRLEEVFDSIQVKPATKKCDAMDGLIRESGTIISETEKGPVRDAGIISAAQKIEHYEIASYSTLVSFAKILGENEAASLLQETLDEEKQADESLTQIAETSINVEAVQAD